MTENKSFSILPLVPYVGSLILFIGAAHCTKFYSSFNIPIFNLVSLSDIPVLVMRGTILFCINCMLFLSIAYIINRTLVLSLKAETMSVYWSIFANPPLSIRIFLVVFLFTLLMLFSVLVAKKQAAKITKELIYFGSKIVLNDSTILMSDSSLTYVGNTRDYIFMYEIQKETARIIPMSNVKEFYIKKSN